jgi:hypothetical protein
VGHIGVMAAAALPITEEELESVANGGERLVLERNGKALAAVVSLADLELLRRLEDEADLAAVRAAKADPSPNVSLAEAFAHLDRE